MTEQEMKQLYLINKPDSCPVCDSGEIGVTYFNYNEVNYVNEIHCGNCSSEWKEIYTLTDVEFITVDPKKQL